MALTSIEPVKEFIVPTDSKSLYIVDDETELLSSLADALSEIGFTPRTFQHPGDLLAITHADDIGCVLTDLRMPGMGGVELLRRLNQQESCLSVILLTAFADVQTAVGVMKLGAISVVEKPFSLMELADEINVAMDQSQRSYHQREQLRDAKSRLGTLIQGEIAVLDLAIEGRPNREIAEVLGISPRTVDRRRQSVLRKLKADSVAEYAVLKTLVAAAAPLEAPIPYPESPELRSIRETAKSADCGDDRNP